MQKILMYSHNGSKNHGCEAIVRATTDMLNAQGYSDIYLISSQKHEDVLYGIDKKVHIFDEINVPDKKSFSFFVAYIKQRLFKDYKMMNKLAFMYPYKTVGVNAISLSIGGDNYCYGDSCRYIDFHKISKEQGQKTVLWGCSVDSEYLDNKEILEDLNSFDKIVVRESISYKAMKQHGLNNVVLYPDPAFTLKKDETFDKLPKDNTVGINVSPLVMKCEGSSGIVLENYLNLVKYILENTDMKVSLIPHVTWEYNDDREALKKIAGHFSDNKRISILDDYNCMQLKQYISKLRFFVGARTHATIAAYSTGVPTLVAGYSVKSKGIAKDLFGTYENYVVPVQGMKSDNELKLAFEWLVLNEIKIRNQLENQMPTVIENSWSASREILML